MERTADDVGRWAGEQERGEVDVAGVGLLLSLCAEETGLTGPDGFDAAVLRRLLLEAFPERVLVEAADVPAVLETVRHLLAYLGARGHADAAALTAALDAAAPDFDLHCRADGRVV